MECSKRKNNIELCRICIMFFIVVHHCIVSGLGLNETLNCANPKFSIYNNFLMLVNAVVIISVNVFWLISGYFGVKFKMKKIGSLLCEIMVCSVLVYAGLIIAGQAEFTIKKLIRYSLLSINIYWFAIVYIAIVITSPALNCIWKYVIEPNENNIFCGLFLGSCILCFVFPDSFGAYLGMNNGYSYLFSVFLYFTGKTIRKHEDVLKEKINFVKSLCGYVITCFLTWGGGTALLLCHKGNLAWKMYSYNAPLVFIGSVFFFLLFLNVNGTSKVQECIGKFGINVFGVYLLHSMPLLKPYRFYIVSKMVRPNNLVMSFVAIIVYCFLLFAVCLVISRIRYNLTRGILTKMKGD